ncbi:MAG: DUF4124 domain-containing protein [Pseudomonadales bacterium]|nr:DUF4124 domain-containing protein [Pseudomonadales bacterium]
MKTAWVIPSAWLLFFFWIPAWAEEPVPSEEVAEMDERQELEVEQPPSRIYRVVDENGNVVFTDHPGKDATSEEVKLKKTNTVPVERVEMPEQLLESEEEEDGTGAPSGGYSRLVIDSPEPGETLRNPSEPVPVQVTLTPSLKGDDKLVLFDNGAPQPAMQLEAPERGAHSLVVKVVGADGQVKMVSAAVEVFVHRSTASDFRPRPPIIDRNGPAADVARPPSRGGAAQVGGAAVSGGGASPGGAASPGKPAQPSRPRPAR